MQIIQALSHEVIELKSEKMKIESGLVTCCDVGELAREKKVNSWLSLSLLDNVIFELLHSKLESP